MLTANRCSTVFVIILTHNLHFYCMLVWGKQTTVALQYNKMLLTTPFVWISSITYSANNDSLNTLHSFSTDVYLPIFSQTYIPHLQRSLKAVVLFFFFCFLSLPEDIWIANSVCWPAQRSDFVLWKWWNGITHPSKPLFPLTSLVCGKKYFNVSTL